MPIFQRELSFRIARRACATCLMAVGLTSKLSAAEVEFSESFLKMEGAPVDLKYFEKGSSVPPGTYSVDLYLNDVLIKRQEITFGADASGQVKPVVSLGLLKELGLNAGKAQQDGLIAVDASDELPIDITSQIARRRGELRRHQPGIAVQHPPGLRPALFPWLCRSIGLGRRHHRLLQRLPGQLQPQQQPGNEERLPQPEPAQRF